MTSSMQSEQCGRDGLALFLSTQVQQALKAGVAPTPEYFQSLFCAFERGYGDTVRVSVVPATAVERATRALADEIAASTAPQLQDVIRGAVEADPAAFVQSLVHENDELKTEARQSSMILEMHKELVDAVKDLVTELERSAMEPAQLNAVKALVVRAEASCIGVMQFPKGVSPFRIMATMEKLVDSHSTVLMQFGRNMPGSAVASCVRVLADAKTLLEEIHGPANNMHALVDQDCEEEQERPRGA